MWHNVSKAQERKQTRTGKTKPIKVQFTPEEARNIYSALDMKRSIGMWGNDPAVDKFKVDYKTIMDKIGVDGANLI